MILMFAEGTELLKS